jgi:dihydroxyacetone kinase-like predicted kinase
MTAAIKHASVGEVTYAVRDTEINGVKIKSGDFMGILAGEIVISTEKRLDAVKHILEQSINEDSLIVTIFYGLNVDPSEVDEIVEYATSINSEVDVQVIDGKQDIYSYIVTVE